MAQLAIQAGVALALGAVSRMLTPTQKVTNEGSRLQNSSISTSTEGSTVPRINGRVRLGGQLIWSTQFLETVESETEEVGGKGGGGGGQEVTTTEYFYSVSCAFAFCEGDGYTRINRLWADGKELNLENVDWEFYDGSESQLPDERIELLEGKAPAYRGTAYVVVKDLPLAPYGNRIPQVTAELVRPSIEDDSLELTMRGVCLIPGASEFGYEETRVYQDQGAGRTSTANVNSGWGKTDLLASLDHLRGSAPNLESVALVVSWFGSSLDAGDCRIEPKVEYSDTKTSPVSWSVDGRERDDVREVSRDAQGKPVYGGTPTDASVVKAVEKIHSRGWTCMFYPFILMDCDDFPWRGRIVATSQSDVDYFVGQLRTKILHYARLLSGTLKSGDSFLIGSELRGMTTSRIGGGYPFVDALIDLADDVRAILPSSVEIGYAADWSEYNAHQSDDGLFFHLDPLWARSSIDFVGVDNYLPLSDWREDEDVYTVNAMMAQVEAGEWYDYYYASEDDRTNNVRTPITDGAHGEPWVYRQKDFRGWWSNAHHDRPNGVRKSTSTAWVPGSKPIRFTEFGCPAVDKGSNRPNVFVDPKSSESALPWFSTGARNDLVQRVYCEATLNYWAANSPAGMLDTSKMYIWAWDARPYPAFPYKLDVWSDGPNWYLGHWLNGRLSAQPLARVVREICSSVGITDVDTTNLEYIGQAVRGFITDQLASPRDRLETLGEFFGFDVVESQGQVRFMSRLVTDKVTLDLDDLVSSDKDPGGYRFRRAQESELLKQVTVSYVDELRDFQEGAADSVNAVTGANRVERKEFNITADEGVGNAVADSLLAESWVRRESGEMSVPWNLFRLDPGDVLNMEWDGVPRKHRITSIEIGESLKLETERFDDGSRNRVAATTVGRSAQGSVGVNAPEVFIMDIPLPDRDIPSLHAPRLLGYADPWPGGINVYEPDLSTEEILDDYSFNSRVTSRGRIGLLLEDLKAGPVGTWDTTSELVAQISSTRALRSTSDAEVLRGANQCAVKTPSGQWEILQFANAEPVGERTYRLTRLLRGQASTGFYMGRPAPGGSLFAMIDRDAMSLLDIRRSQVGAYLPLRYGPVGVPVADPRYTDSGATPLGVGLRPFAPAHARAQWLTGGSIALTWLRSDRFDEGSWDQETPMSEDREKYEVDILDSGSVVRTLVASSEEVTYSAAQQEADFGSVTRRFDVRIYQISALVGRGVPLEVAIHA